MQVIDALEAGDVRLFLCTDGVTVGASVNAELKQGSVLASLCGYGSSANAAVLDLAERLTKLEDFSHYIVVNAMGEGKRRAVRWNGTFWKSHYEPAS